MLLELDPWQKEVLSTKGNICLVSGRQTGKSTIIAMKAAEFIVSNQGKSVMVVSVTEEQAEQMLLKILDYLMINHKALIAKGKNKPTKHLIRLTNKSLVRCKAVGMAGIGIRGFTIDMLIADEAAFMPEEVWAAVMPMLLTTGGDIVLVSTPHGRKNFFHQCYHDPGFRTFHINSLEVAEKRKEPGRSIMLNFIEQQRKLLSKNRFTQEYLGQFVDELNQWFSDDIIKRAMILKRRETISPKEYYLGVDVARMGGDESTFEILERIGVMLYHVDSIVMKRVYLNETTSMVLELNRKYDFRRIYIDDGGIGVGVFDYLLSNDETKRKVVAINNRARAITREEHPKKKKLLKEDLYNNMLGLMERGEIKLLDDDSVFLSLKSVQYEYTDSNELIISGNYTHIIEGLIRAAWCMQEKNINTWFVAL